jgi:hypothetical protein
MFDTRASRATQSNATQVQSVDTSCRTIAPGHLVPFGKFFWPLVSQHRPPSGDGSYARQSSSFDARYQGIARIEYPLHPLFKREGRVVRRVQYPRLTCLELEIEQKIVIVAPWMTRADVCQRLTCGHDPIPQIDSLLQVLRLLDEHKP